MQPDKFHFPAGYVAGGASAPGVAGVAGSSIRWPAAAGGLSAAWSGL
jgi:hypothetical protein